MYLNINSINIPFSSFGTSDQEEAILSIFKVIDQEWIAPNQTVKACQSGVSSAASVLRNRHRDATAAQQGEHMLSLANKAASM